MYCSYCKDKIKKHDKVCYDKDKKCYHLECFNQMNSYIDEFGETSTDEFGESSANEYGY